MSDEFRFTLTTDAGEEVPIGLDVPTALRLWQDLGDALDRYAADHPDVLTRRVAGEQPADGERAH